MQIQYQYDGETFTSLYKLRQKLWEKAGILVRAPKENKAEFWASLGVTYTETPDPLPPEPTLEELKTAKLSTLETAFLQWYETDATVISSLGFECDSDARAMMDVSGLVVAAEAQTYDGTPLYFMDAKNVPHEVNEEQLKTIQLEIIAAGQAAYQQKWALRAAIESAEDKETLEGIVIAFTPSDFSQDGEA